MIENTTDMMGMAGMMDAAGAAMMGDDESVEIEILDDSGVRVDLEPAEPQPEFGDNLAEFMDEGDLTALASDIIESVDEDVLSRKDWVDAYIAGLNVLGMKYDKRTEPWANACGVYSTVLTEAAVRFQSEMITETFPAQGPVKTRVLGASNKDKEQAAERVREDMNYQLTEVMTEYRPEHEKLLFSLGLAGTAFKKVYADPSLGRQTAMFITAEDLIIPYGSDVYNAERVTHLMRKTKNDIKKLQKSGFYRDIELGEPVRIISDIEKKKAEEQGYSLTDDDRYQVCEVHVDYDLKGFEDVDANGEKTGIALPYVATIEKGTQKVLAIRRNWNEEDPIKLRRQHFVQYTYIPGFGAYGFGLIHLIGGYAQAGTSIIRQLVDSGTLSNLPGGLKTRGLRMNKGEEEPIGPAEWRDVDVPSGSIRDNIMPLPYKEPSQVLAALLDRLTEEARRLASISDMKISDMSAQAPVGTTLAILERTLKTMSAVQARVHSALRMEFKLLKGIIRDHMEDSYSYDPEGAERSARGADYDKVEVLPVSDPNASTMAQRIMQYQAATQLAQQAPQIYNLPYLHRQMVEVLGIKQADKIVPIQEDQGPRDPISENMGFLTSKPTQAFIQQDHDAHIAVHTALMQDPMIMQMLGQSPMGQQIGAAIMAHVSQHLAFSYRQKIEEQLGVPLPPPDAELPPEIEVQLSRLTAQAAQQLLQQNQATAQQQQAQQQAQNPELQLRMAELKIKESDSRRKDEDSIRDYEIAQERLRIEKMRVQADIGKSIANTESKEKQEDKRVRAELAKTVYQTKQQQKQQANQQWQKPQKQDTKE